MRITPMMRKLIRRKLRRDAPEPGQGELNIVPFLDIVVNLMLFLMATTSAVLSISQVEAQLPGYGPRHGRHALALAVVVADEAILVRGRDVDPIRIARRADGYDFDALTRTAESVKLRFPDEHEVTVSADPGVPYEDVIRAMDALRRSPSGALFPDVLVAAGVR